MKRLLMIVVLTPALLATQQQSNRMPMMGNCPTALEGTSAVVTDTPTGVAILLTTNKPENVAELRRRAEQMAAMHNTDAPTPTMMRGKMLPGTVKYEAVDKGARLVLTPKDPAKLAEFRKEVRTHVERMNKGECTMMMDMMQGMMQGMSGKEMKPERKKDETDHNAHHPEDKK